MILAWVAVWKIYLCSHTIPPHAHDQANLDHVDSDSFPYSACWCRGHWCRGQSQRPASQRQHVLTSVASSLGPFFSFSFSPPLLFSLSAWNSHLALALLQIVTCFFPNRMGLWIWRYTLQAGHEEAPILTPLLYFKTRPTVAITQKTKYTQAHAHYVLPTLSHTHPSCTHIIFKF